MRLCVLVIPLSLLLPVANGIARGDILQGPSITAKSAAIIDAESGKFLWQKDAFTPRFPASTTKIMTAILLTEHCRMDDVIVAPPDIEKVGESSMHLKSGEKVSVHDMLYALMLRSANDGCVAVADHVAGSVPRFVQMMNEKARELGCTHTHFDNPNGLNDKFHYTCAHDLALIARYAMTIPAIENVVKTVRYKISRSIDVHDLWMVNHDKWLKKDPTADGVKTGWTIPAGHCFVGSAMRNGYRVIDVELKSDDWQADNDKMLKWAYHNHVRKLILPTGASVGEAEIQDGAPASSPVAISQPLTGIFNSHDLDRPETKLELNPNLEAPIAKGQVVGRCIAVDQNGDEIGEAPVVSLDEVNAKQSIVKREARTIPLFLIGCVMVGGYFAIKVKTRRTSYWSRLLK